MTRSPNRRLLLFGVVVAVALVLVSLVTALSGPGQIHRGSPAPSAYGSGYEHTATWDQPLHGAALDHAELPYLVKQGALTFFNPASAAFDLAAHERVADELVRRARAQGHHLSVFEYFNVSFWLSYNEAGLRPYSDSFSPSWLLRSTDGQQIPYRSTVNGPPQGYMLDLRNAQLRSWIVTSVTAWMRAAHYAGVVLDGASPLLPDNTRMAVAQGVGNFGQLLCGTSSATCPALVQWNIGLGDVVAGVTAALNRLGDRTIYNGITPGAAHGAGRNLGLLAHADGTLNESFCYGPLPDRNSKGIEQLLPDLAIMRQAAQQHKTLVEVTNYQDYESPALAQYCTGAFLIGWQPHSTYFIFHRVYGDLDDSTRVASPENDLRLGMPTTPDYRQAGGVLTRDFARGRVIVNAGSAAATATFPRAYDQYAGGRRVASWQRGQTIHLKPFSAVFLLDAARGDAGTR